jgi:hypothetical protein
MKFSALSIGLLALLTPLTAAWSKEGKQTKPHLPSPPLPVEMRNLQLGLCLNTDHRG